MDKSTGKAAPQCAVYYYIDTPCQTLSPARQGALTLQILHDAFLSFFGIPLQESLIKRTSYGKPYYDSPQEYFFNITHCSAAVAVAVAGVSVGIDIEAPRPVKCRTAKKCCNNRELEYIFKSSKCLPDRAQDLTGEEAKRFLSLWTLKESYVKMTGDGMRIPFQSVCFDITAFKETGQHVIEWIKPGQYQSCLYTPGNITIAVTLQQKPDLLASNVLWYRYCGES